MSDDLDKRYTDPEPEDDYDEEFYDEDEELSGEEQKECGNSCSHFDSLNQCCWQAGKWGLCFHVEEGDLCHLNRKRKEASP